MDAVFALARSLAGWLTDLRGRGLSDFYAMAVGMRTWLLGSSGDEEQKGILAKARKLTWVGLIVVNLVIALMVVQYAKRAQQTDPPSPVSATTSPSPSTTPTEGPTDPPFESIYNIRPWVSTDHTWAWALIDRQSGIMVGSENWATSQYILSSIKPWIAADYFNSHPDVSQAVLNDFTSMIVDSNDAIAYTYWGGSNSLTRLIQACGLTDVVRRDWSWSLTEFSARDDARYMDCLYTGHATSPEWTAWLLDKMRNVRGEGDFGIRELFNPRTSVATKNGWYDWEGRWYVNCLAATDKWSLAITQQWPAPGRWSGGDLKPGIAAADPICTSLAKQVLRL